MEYPTNRPQLEALQQKLMPFLSLILTQLEVSTESQEDIQEYFLDYLHNEEEYWTSYFIYAFVHGCHEAPVPLILFFEEDDEKLPALTLQDPESDWSDLICYFNFDEHGDFVDIFIWIGFKNDIVKVTLPYDPKTEEREDTYLLELLTEENLPASYRAFFNALLNADFSVHLNQELTKLKNAEESSTF